jgi:hypothetical protein
MPVILSKLSLPDAWDLEFTSVRDAMAELRRHICGMCFSGEEFGDPPIDLDHDGKRYVCYDPETLLSTACGLEFSLEGDHGLWPDSGDMEADAHRRVPRRKRSKAQVTAA